MTQVFVKEHFPEAGPDGAPRWSMPQLAFGSHPDAEDYDDGQVTSAVALSTDVYIVLSGEVATPLSEIRCLDGYYDLPEPGSTAEDIANCRYGNLDNCTAVCQGVGIADDNFDGMPDQGRFVGDVGVACNGRRIEPSAGFYALRAGYPVTSRTAADGPLIKLSYDSLETSSTCTIEIDETVVGMDGTSVCAPPGGDVELDCVPETEISFAVVPLELLGSAPAPGETDVDPQSFRVILQFNAYIATDSLSSITVSNADGPVAVRAERDDSHWSMVYVYPETDLPGRTLHTVTVPAGSDGTVDVHGGELIESTSFSFTTRGYDLPL